MYVFWRIEVNNWSDSQILITSSVKNQCSEKYSFISLEFENLQSNTVFKRSISSMYKNVEYK